MSIDSSENVPFDKDEIISRLICGGLIRILTLATATGHDEPLVWLRRGADGGLTFTFDSAGGGVAVGMAPIGTTGTGRFSFHEKTTSPSFCLILD